MTDHQKTIDMLVAAMKGLMAEYKKTADSGDCGFWKAEEQDEYIQCEKALSIIKRNEGNEDE